MTGNTIYLKDKYLCDLPCFIKPQYSIPNKTYSYCNNNIKTTYSRNLNYISFNYNGYVILYDLMSRSRSLNKTLKANVYLYLYVEKTKNIC